VMEESAHFTVIYAHRNEGRERRNPPLPPVGITYAPPVLGTENC